MRDLIVARLTLYNGRRGEEPARILVREYEEAMSDEWLPSNDIEKIDDPAEKYLVGQYKLAYLHGKGKKFVPVLIPNDLIKGIDVLLKFREEFGIKT